MKKLIQLKTVMLACLLVMVGACLSTQASAEENDDTVTVINFFPEDVRFVVMQDGKVLADKTLFTGGSAMLPVDFSNPSHKNVIHSYIHDDDDLSSLVIDANAVEVYQNTNGVLSLDCDTCNVMYAQ